MSNPFADPAPASGPPGAWGSSSPMKAPAAVVTIGGQDAAAKDPASVSYRLAELNQREADLKRMELELRSKAKSSAKTWPPCCPMIRNDIAGEVPAAGQGMVRCAFTAWLGLMCCLFVNFIGTIALLIAGGGDNLSSFLWAAIYLVGGVPGALVLWYKRLYSASISDSGLGYSMFFAFFLAHLIFAGWSAIAPPILNSYSHTGFWTAWQIIKWNAGCGTIYFIGAGLWTVELLWSFYTLRLVYGGFRGRGITAQKLRQEATMKAAFAVV